MRFDPTMILAAAGSTSVTLVINSVSLALFGIPIVAWAAAFSGSLFGLAFFPAESKLNKPLVALANMLAAIFLTALVVGLADSIGLNLSSKTSYVGGVAFLIAVAPLPFIKFLRGKLGVTDA